MAGRNAQPIEIIKKKGKSHHLTKKEIERRKKQEIKIGDKKFKPPDYVKNDVVAFSKWKELMILYKDIECVTTPDSGTIARYCKHYAEYMQLMDQREKVTQLEIDWDNWFMQVDELIKDGVSKIFKIEPLLKIEAAINKKSDMLTKFEDRLFLNPVSRIKNVPGKEKEEEDPHAEMFGD